MLPVPHPTEHLRPPKCPRQRFPATPARKASITRLLRLRLPSLLLLPRFRLLPRLLLPPPPCLCRPWLPRLRPWPHLSATLSPRTPPPASQGGVCPPCPPALVVTMVRVGSTSSITRRHHRLRRLLHRHHLHRLRKYRSTYVCPLGRTFYFVKC